MASDACLRSPKPKFSVYQNPTLSAALTANSLRPSATVLLLISASAIASAISLIVIYSREESLIKSLTRIHMSSSTAALITKVVQAALSLVSLLSGSALIRALSMRNPKNTSRKPKEDQKDRNTLTPRQLGLLGVKAASTATSNAEFTIKPPKSKPSLSQPSIEPLVPLRKMMSSYTPTRPSRSAADQQIISSAVSPPSAQYAASPSTPWSRKSSGSAKGIQTEKMLEQFLAEVDEKIAETSNVSATPTPTIRSFGVATPSTVTSSTTPGGVARSTPLRPVRMSPGSHQKYSTPPKKGEGELRFAMSIEEALEAFENLGIYPYIEQWRDRLRQWFSAVLLNPLVEKIKTSHVQVLQTASSLGLSITVSVIGSESPRTVPAASVSPIDGVKEWQPTFTLDEDGFLHQLRASLLQARDGSMSLSHLAGQQPQQNPQLPQLLACIDAITEYQRLNSLMKGELIKGLLPQSSIRQDYTVQRVRDLAEGTCLKNYDFMGNGDCYSKADRKWASELPTDPHLLLYLLCAFLEHPKWMLHVDPASYTDAQSSKNPLFLGVLPPKDIFPEKYVAVISGVPSILHPGACILAVGKQSPPIFTLYWDKKLQFSLQGRTALWDALLLLCHRIKLAYGGIVRGVHLGSSAFNLLQVIDPDVDI